jgi:hypothetical protein
MDGTLAVLFFIYGLTDMTVNYCPTGCLAYADAPARVSLQGADVRFDGASTGRELALGYDLPATYGPFQPTVSLSATDGGDIWVGAGAKWTSGALFNTPLFIESTFQPGLHIRGDGPDLGGQVHFRAGLGVGYRFDNGARLTVSYDHRSNGDRLDTNPGLETLSVRYAVTWE